MMQCHNVCVTFPSTRPQVMLEPQRARRCAVQPNSREKCDGQHSPWYTSPVCGYNFPVLLPSSLLSPCV